MATKKVNPNSPTAAQGKQNKPQQASHAKPFMDIFNRENYMILGAGILLLIVGYLLMSGGGQKPNEWKVEEIYGFQRITLAPIIVILGYAVVVFGIMKMPRGTAK